MDGRTLPSSPDLPSSLVRTRTTSHPSTRSYLPVRGPRTEDDLLEIPLSTLHPRFPSSDDPTTRTTAETRDPSTATSLRESCYKDNSTSSDSVNPTTPFS